MADEQTTERPEASPGGESVTRRKQMLVRVPHSMVPRIERAAKRLGLSCSALIVLSTVEKLERLEG